MKKLMTGLLILLLTLGLTGALADSVSGDYTYVLLPDGTAKITGYNGSAETLLIPDQLGGRAVTVIGREAFKNCDQLTAVTIPEGVRVIEEGAFLYCSRLRRVTLPDSLTTLQHKAFGFTVMRRIALPARLTVIEGNPFTSCYDLEDITVSPANPVLMMMDGVLVDRVAMKLLVYPYALEHSSYTTPSGIRSIGDYAFSPNISLKTLVISEGVTEIGRCSFEACYSLTSVTFPGTLTTIGQGAFSFCFDMNGIHLPSSVRTIGDEAFRSCNATTEVIIPEGVTSIGKTAFGYNKGLLSVTIPSSVRLICDSAFSGCPVLTSISIAEGVTTIESAAFSFCPELTTINLPASATNIGSLLFLSSDKVKTVAVVRGSYAERWVQSNGLQCEYPVVADVDEMQVRDSAKPAGGTTDPRQLPEGSVPDTGVGTQRTH